MIIKPKNIKVMDFKQWMNSDQVITRMDKFGNEFFSTQDANYHNKIYGVQNLLTYYKREFLITQ